MTTSGSAQDTEASPMVRWTRALERATGLDRPIKVVRPLAHALVADPARRDILHGTWLGHAVHPVLTDVVIGFWTSANVLDLVGGTTSRTAARRLVGLGVLSAVPTCPPTWRTPWKSCLNPSWEGFAPNNGGHENRNTDHV